MEDTNLWIIVAAVCVFFGAVFVYVLLMVFFPEWVGITGKKAIEAERSHQEGSAASDDDLSTRMQQNKAPKKD